MASAHCFRWQQPLPFSIKLPVSLESPTLPGTLDQRSPDDLYSCRSLILKLLISCSKWAHGSYGWLFFSNFQSCERNNEQERTHRLDKLPSLTEETVRCFHLRIIHPSASGRICSTRWRFSFIRLLHRPSIFGKLLLTETRHTLRRRPRRRLRLEEPSPTN